MVRLVLHVVSELLRDVKMSAAFGFGPKLDERIPIRFSSNAGPSSVNAVLSLRF
jgi:hypothetical protein